MFKKKVKRYAGNDESLVDSDYAYDPISKIVGESEIKRAAADDSAKYREDQPSTGLKKETFGEAFKRNQARGAKTFEFGGKKYSTETKEQKATRTKPAEKTKSESKQASSEVPKASPEELTKRSAREKEQALAESHPEAILPVGRIAKLLSAAAPSAKAGRGERIEPKFSKNWRNEQDITPGAAQLAREARMIGREPARIGREPKRIGMDKGTRERPGPRDLDEERMAGEGGPNFRRGGKVNKGAPKQSMSSMPKQSKASSRGDGIAQRGKTKGRMV